MVNFTTAQMRSMMDKSKNIRNMSVIAHVDHGKSTLTDSLVQKAGIISASAAGNQRYTDTRQDEQDRCITIKSTGISLFFEYNNESGAKLVEDEGNEAVTIGKDSYLINLIDSPGHVDFSSEVTAALRVTDGALVVVDCVEGVAVQTETVLRQALSERVKPVVMCNKLDRVLLELNLPPEECYRNLTRVIEDVNVLISTYADVELKKAFLAPKDLKTAEAARAKTMGKRADGPPKLAGIEKKDYDEDQWSIYDSWYRKSVEAFSNALEDEGIENPILVDACRGTVAFGSGLHQWGFTLVHFAKVYAAKFKIDVELMTKNLWGENFYDPKGKCFRNKSHNGKLRRGFVHFILDPMYKLFEVTMQEHKFTNKAGKEVLKCFKMFKQLGIKLKKDEKELRQKLLLKRAMQRWLPAAEALMEMIVLHLPSPWKAQGYRTELLYMGKDMNDRYAMGMKSCNKAGPLMMYISKMVPTSDKGRFYAFGRIFSGTMATGKKCRIMGPNYEQGNQKKDLKIKPVQRTVIMMGRITEQVTDVPSGNTCALVGVDQYILKSATLTDDRYDDIPSIDCGSIRSMKFSVSPVVRVAVSPKNAQDLPKLVEALKRLSKSDPMVVISHSDSGDHIIAGAGELHLEICLKDLEEDYMKGAPIVVKEPVVSYCESVSLNMPESRKKNKKGEDVPNVNYQAEVKQRTALAKSANKHNRLYITCAPCSDEFVQGCIDGEIRANDAVKTRARLMADNYGWDVRDAQRIWKFGPEEKDVIPTNVVVDSTKGVQYLNEIKESVNAGFNWACATGPFCDEPLRGVRFDLQDVTLHADSIHRGMGQIMPPTRRSLYGSMYFAEPSIVEPYFLAEITVPSAFMGGCYSTLSQRRGVVVSENPRAGTPMTVIKSHLPVAESFGFTEALRSQTSGTAFPQCVFDHYAALPGTVFKEGSQAYDVCRKIRARKGLDVELSPIGRYIDKL